MVIGHGHSFPDQSLGKARPRALDRPKEPSATQRQFLSSHSNILLTVLPPYLPHSKPPFPFLHNSSIMFNLRQRIQIVILLLLTLFVFASYHEGTGGTAWLQWLATISILAFALVFDLAFTNESSFIFDPDADNWRRKVVS